MDDRTLAIATWGQPALWREARYVSEDGERKVEHCTTLPLLLELYNNSDAVLLVLDSLMDEYAGRAEGRCFGCYDELRGSVRAVVNSYSYRELRERVKGFVREMLRCLEIDGDVAVVVCPAVGRPGGQWTFDSSPTDYEAVALAELGPYVLDKRYNRVVLDVSHGVNFMPSVALRVAERLAGLLLVAHDVDQPVTLEVYNSDPYPPRTNSLPQLRLNLVAKERVTSARVPSLLPPKLVSCKRRVEQRLEETVSELNGRYRQVVRLPLSALHYPLPLALLYSLSRVQDRALVVLKEALALWEENVTIVRESREVKGVLRLHPDAVYALLLVEAVRKRIADPEYPASLELLKRCADLYRAFNESYYFLISHELNAVEGMLREKRPSAKLRLCEFYGEERDSGKPDKRVMIAHAGLQKEFVAVDPSNDQLSYTHDVEKLLGDSGLLVR